MGVDRERRVFSRRDLLRDAATASAGIALLPGLAQGGRARPGRQGGGDRVAVLGGGNAGLTVAHELIERGFDVTVYERKALGGKSRTIPVPDSAENGRAPLPGEHGFRFFAGFYQNAPDTLRRIPYPGNANGVYDNLVSTNETVWVRGDGRANSFFFGFAPDPTEDLSVDGLQRILTKEFIEGHGLLPHEAAYIAERLVVFMTSSHERRFGEWEHVSWWDFIGAESRSEEYQRVAGYGMSTLLVAGQPRLASTRTIGTIAEAFIMAIMQRGNDGPPVRILNAPTNEAWIDPWVEKMRGDGVRFEVGTTIEGLVVEDGSHPGRRAGSPPPHARRPEFAEPGASASGGGRIAAAIARDADGSLQTIEADWFVVAMPVERARTLWSADVLRHDPHLAAMDDLLVAWMSGIMYYLREPVDVPEGHLAFLDSPWALTAIAQKQFWAGRDFAADYGDGEAVDCFSAIVSDWDTPGQFNGKPARECTADEIQREVWRQMKAALEKDEDHEVLPDDIVHTWFLDPAITWSEEEQQNRSDEPLMINTVGSWEKRPTAASAIPNLFLAGDHVQTEVDLATMEGADEAGRRAANALLEAAGSSAEPVTVYGLYDPPEFEALKQVDAQLYEAGQPHALDHGR
jgi:uncharacterized protein with NAD-binding domain and iron-sulfur cluster